MQQNLQSMKRKLTDAAGSISIIWQNSKRRRSTQKYLRKRGRAYSLYSLSPYSAHVLIDRLLTHVARTTLWICHCAMLCASGLQMWIGVIMAMISSKPVPYFAYFPRWRNFVLVFFLLVIYTVYCWNENMYSSYWDIIFQNLCVSWHDIIHYVLKSQHIYKTI